MNLIAPTSFIFSFEQLALGSALHSTRTLSFTIRLAGRTWADSGWCFVRSGRLTTCQRHAEPLTRLSPGEGPAGQRAGEGADVWGPWWAGPEMQSAHLCQPISEKLLGFVSHGLGEAF